jgi:hypothetical protein
MPDKILETFMNTNPIVTLISLIISILISSLILKKWLPIKSHEGWSFLTKCILIFLVCFVFGAFIISSKRFNTTINKDTVIVKDTIKVYDTIKSFQKNNPKQKESFSFNGNNNITSKNQSGGINGPVTIHTPNVNIDKPIPPEWVLMPSVKITDTLWRAKFVVKTQGDLPYPEWNLLLTFNTEFVNVEKIPEETYCGTYYPEGIRDGFLNKFQYAIAYWNLSSNQIFSFYIYTKDSIIEYDKQSLPHGQIKDISTHH